MKRSKPIPEELVRRVLAEDVLTTAQARAELQALTGIRPDKATLIRWITRYQLDAVKIGNQWVTSRQALTRMIEARTAAAIG